MSSPFGWRVVLVVLLVTTLFALCVWFGTLGPAPEVAAYPGDDDIGPTPAEYVGGPVTISGTVTTTNPVQIDIEYGVDQSRVLTVTGVDVPVEAGDTLRVYGTLVDADTVAATTVVTIPLSGFLYMYSVSFVAGLWVLGRIATQWRFDLQQGLVRRTTPLNPREQLRAWARTGGSDDA